ncbi:MAG: KEOPS complex subunit Cgi121 [Candidatus Thorarchaeota archaeon]
MLLEEFTIAGDLFHVGITEIRNRLSLEASKLVTIARDMSADLLAVQFLSAENIAGAIHLLSAVQNALNAWTGGYAISKSLDVEIIVYASAQNQIGRAFDHMGLHGTPETIAAVLVADTVASVEQVLGTIVQHIGPEVHTPFKAEEARIQRVKAMFDITGKEISMFLTGDSLQERLDALGRCVASRVSTVAVEF